MIMVRTVYYTASIPHSVASEAIDTVVGRPWSDFDDELCKRMASLAIVDGIGLGKCMEKMSRD